jgi:GT2 family glycosyltransferase
MLIITPPGSFSSGPVVISDDKMRGPTALSMAPQPPVSIVILNYNGREFLQGCLDSILADTYDSFEVIFTDNASSDGSVDYVRENYPEVRILQNEVNLGFAEGNNRAVDVATHDHIVLVNNDVVVEAGWLQGLVDAIEQPGVAIASSLVRTVGIPDLFYERNGTINLVGHNVMLAFEDPKDLFMCTGCSLIFRRSEFGHPFDPDYFAYAEDVYLGMRARFAGRYVRHTNESRLLHLGGGTAKKQRSAFISFYQERNRLLNDLLFFGAWTRLRLWPVLAANAVMKVLYGLLKARRGLPGIFRAYGWLLTHPWVIAEKRRALEEHKRVSDADVLRVMSCKVVDGESVPARFLNGLSKLYCTLVGLKTIEHEPPSLILNELRSRM